MRKRPGSDSRPEWRLICEARRMPDNFPLLPRKVEGLKILMLETRRHERIVRGINIDGRIDFDIREDGRVESVEFIGFPLGRTRDHRSPVPDVAGYRALYIPASVDHPPESARISADWTWNEPFAEIRFGDASNAKAEPIGPGVSALMDADYLVGFRFDTRGI